jgi:F-type H+-transporting ATPase subunit b
VKQVRNLIAAPTAAAALVVATAAAASEAAHGGEGLHGPDEAAWLSLGFSFFNFFLFVFLLYRYAWPAVRDFLASRHDEVAAAMAAAEQARMETEAIRNEFAQKEAALEETRRRMIEDIRQGAAVDREKALREAQAAAARLRAEAERQAEYDLARARRELRAEAAKLAAEIAEKEVSYRITAADGSRLVREFVQGVARP